MARKQGWTLFLSFLFGLLAASLFWFYTPFLPGQKARPGADSPLGAELRKGAGSPSGAAGSQVRGDRFQVVTNGQQVFLADLKEGRVWRYFHLSKDSQVEEGFLPLAMFYGGKKYFRASEVEAGPPPPEKKPQ